NPRPPDYKRPWLHKVSFRVLSGLFWGLAFMTAFDPKQKFSYVKLFINLLNPSGLFGHLAIDYIIAGYSLTRRRL
ncbi:MAG: hypothetical protein KAI73_08825, partial [Rhodospirillaceae bacterium]|nr:hypothetical protein [Rhodospirillaceae bacterium]